MKHKFLIGLVSCCVLAVVLAGCGSPTPAPAITPAPQATLGAPGTGVTVQSVRPVYEIIGEKSAPMATVSPDGTRIAWVQSSGTGKDRVGQLCLFTFENAAKKCYDISRDLFYGYPYQLQWQPDSSTIAFTENPIQQGYESDIWLFKVSDGSFTDLTDDGAAGGYTALAKGSFALDYLPSWNTADGKIYFWRVVPQGNLTANVGIFRIAPTGGQPEQVYDVTTTLPQQLPMFDSEAFFLDGFSAVSPDGTKLAALVSTFQDDVYGSSSISLWLFDLANTGAAPKQLMTPDAFQAALPAWQADQGNPARAVGLAWTGDSASVVAMAISSSNATPFFVFYHVDVASGKATPVVDFSQIPTSQAYFEPAPGSDIIWRYYSPWTGSLSPNNDKLLMLSNLGGTAALLVGKLPPDGKLPGVAGSADASSISSVSLSSRSKDGKVLMYGLMLTVTEQ
jgi:hypothetical protein